jgi:hypothetical protein
MANWPFSHIPNRNKTIVFAGFFDFFQESAGIFGLNLPMGIIIKKQGKAGCQGITQKKRWLTIIKTTLSWAENEKRSSYFYISKESVFIRFNKQAIVKALQI